MHRNSHNYKAPSGNSYFSLLTKSDYLADSCIACLILHVQLQFNQCLCSLLQIRPIKNLFSHLQQQAHRFSSQKIYMFAQEMTSQD